MTQPSGPSAASNGDLKGRRFVVTGANSGIGEAAALAFAGRGATVVLACRDAQRGADAAARIRAVVAGAQLEVRLLDLASLASVREFAAAVVADRAPVDVLVNNAGVMAIPRRETADGFEMQLGTNHLGHFALTGQLLPALLAADAPRVVTISSLAHKTGAMNFADLQSEREYDKRKAYGQSKLANLLFAFELQRRADAAGVPLLSVAAHPGVSSTNLAVAGPQMEGRGWARPIIKALGHLLPSAEGGARPTVMAATEVGAKGGSYFGPSGPLELWGRAQLVTANASAHDAVAAGLLWTASEQLTGVTYGELDVAVA